MTCPRPGCGGLVFTQYGDTHCISCGWYAVEPYVEPVRVRRCLMCKETPAEGHKICEAHLRYLRAYKMCLDCGEEPRVPKRKLCSACLGARISRGFANKR